MDEIRAITMPKFGLSMTEGKVVSWWKNESDDIKVGDDLVDIETTKITNTLESPTKGILRRHVAKTNEELPVGALIAVVADAETTESAIDDFVARFQTEFSVTQDNSVSDTVTEPKFVELDGMRIRYLEVGVDDGVPVVFVHGFGGDLNNWLFTQPAIASNHKTLSFDLPGHGGSSKQTSGTLLDLADKISKALRTLQIDKAHFVGHSLGAAVVLQIALSDPSVVASLTLIAPASLGDRINGEFIKGLVEADRRKTLEPVLQKLFVNKSLVSRDMVDDLIKFKRLDGALAALSAIADANFPDAHQSANFSSRLKEIEAPVLIISGDHDEIVPLPSKSDLASAIRFHLIPNSGHMPHMENATEVNALVERFIDQAE